MGKVASDKCHKWVFKEPTECEPNISNYWQSSFDAVCIINTSSSLLITIYHFLLSLKWNLLLFLSWFYWILQLPPEWTDQFDSGIQVFLFMPFMCLWFCFRVLPFVLSWSAATPDYCGDTSWSWASSARFLQDCEFCLGVLISSGSVENRLMGFLFLFFGFLSDSWRSSLCAEDETYFWIIRLPIWVLPVSIILINKE